MFFNTYCISCTILGSGDTEVGEPVENSYSHGAHIPTDAERQ